jgi:hypothetical protein
MSYWAQIRDSDSVVVGVAPNLSFNPNTEDPNPIPGMSFQPLAFQDDSLMGKVWNGVGYDDPPVIPRTLLNYEEWVGTWTEDEWDELRVAIRDNTYNDNPIPAAFRKKLNRWHDAIRVTNSVDVKASAYSDLLDRFVSVGFITSSRKAELQEGV